MHCEMSLPPTVGETDRQQDVAEDTRCNLHSAQHDASGTSEQLAIMTAEASGFIGNRDTVDRWASVAERCGGEWVKFTPPGRTSPARAPCG